MMQPSRPIDGDIALAAIQPRRALHTAPRTDATELKQAIKHGTVIANIVLALLLGKTVHVVGGDPLQEVDVLVGVELRHLVLGGGLGAVDLELLVEAVVHDQAVRHPDAVRLHGMSGVVGVVAHIAVVEVGHLLGLCRRDVRAVGGFEGRKGAGHGLGVVGHGAR